MKKTNRRISNGFYRTGDPRSCFHESSPMPLRAVTPENIGYPRTLLSNSSKTNKGERQGVSTKVMYLTPGAFCPAATEGCRSSCLGFSSGRMSYRRSALARDRRSALLMHQQEHFFAMLDMEIDEHRMLSVAQGLTPAVRLNGSSDVLWEKRSPELFLRHSRVQFYDYTKIPGRAAEYSQREASSSDWPRNYHLTFSLSERNTRHFGWMLKHGVNVAVVFERAVPSEFHGYPTLDGDRSDARFLDDSPRVVGLSAKGAAREDLTGFVVREGQGELVVPDAHLRV